MVGLAVSSSGLVAQAIARGAIQIPDELQGLADILAALHPRNVMEIGSEAGGTFWLWCQIAARDGIKISVDKPDGDWGSGRFAGEKALLERTLQFQAFAPKVEVVTGDSHSSVVRSRVLTILDGELLDFLFIDGDHSYEGVKADFEDYRKLVRPGGLIAFHDINDTQFHRYRGCVVSEFWNEFTGPKREFTVRHAWGGIGVIEN